MKPKPVFIMGILLLLLFPLAGGFAAPQTKDNVADRQENDKAKEEVVLIVYDCFHSRDFEA